MNRPTMLITGGCSFSQVPNNDVTWAKHLEKHLSPDYHIHTARAAAGNELISHRIIHKVNRAIELGFNPENIFVAVMWSGCDRMHLMTTNFDKMWEEGTVLGPKTKSHWTTEPRQFQKEFYERDGIEVDEFDRHNHWYSACSPSWVVSDPEGEQVSEEDLGTLNLNWHTLNSAWTDEMTVKYFTDFVSPEYALIQTCEHILRTQWFLKSHHIKFFMTQYTPETFVYYGPPAKTPDGKSPYTTEAEGIPTNGPTLRHVALIDEHPDINWMYKMIDRNYWLDIPDFETWIGTNCKDLAYRSQGDPHPSTEMQLRLTQEIILPFLLEKYHIS